MALAVVEATEATALDACALGQQARAIASQISRLEGELVGIIQDLARCQGGLIDMTVRQYVGWQAGLTPAEAARLCRLATRLELLPKLTAELASGRMSAGTATALAAVATPQNEAALIDTASVATGAQLQTLLRAYKQNAEPGDDERPPPTDSVTYGVNDGRWRLRADLAPELGAQFEAALRAEKEAAIADAQDRDDGAGMLARDAARSNAAAFVGMAQSVLGGKVRRDGILPDRFHILLHLDEDHLGGQIQGGGHIEPRSVTELLCESWITLVIKRNGQPATITSPTRLATPAQHRACRFRDAGAASTSRRITSSTGRTTARPNSTTWCCSVRRTTRWRTSRAGASSVTPRETCCSSRRTAGSSCHSEDPRSIDDHHRLRFDRPQATYDRLTQWGSSVILDAWLN